MGVRKGLLQYTLWTIISFSDGQDLTFIFVLFLLLFFFSFFILFRFCFLPIIFWISFGNGPIFICIVTFIIMIFSIHLDSPLYLCP